MTRVELQYIGAVSLLGRLSRHIEDEEDMCCIEMAMNDLVAALPGRFEIVECHRGWSLEPLPEKEAT
jgi:hypothetical protein